MPTVEGESVPGVERGGTDHQSTDTAERRGGEGERWGVGRENTTRESLGERGGARGRGSTRAEEEEEDLPTARGGERKGERRQGG